MTHERVEKGCPTKVDTLHRILLLDDEPSVLFALKLLMEAVGYSVVDFSDPQAAIAYLKDIQENEASMTAENQLEPPVELFISDLKMPHMNGLKVLEEAKKIAPDLPFVLMSAHAQNHERDQAAALGSFGFLAKPFTPQQLHEVVNAVSLHRKTYLQKSASLKKCG